MIIGAVGDVHGRRFLEYLKAATMTRQPDLLLLAGDLTEDNDVDQYAMAVDELRARTTAEMIAVFGNEEYEGTRPSYKDRFPLRFLDDESVVLDRSGMKVKIVGTTGPLDRPTWWQRTNLPDAWRRYQLRLDKIGSLLERDDADLLILLSHYAPTYRTLAGEREDRFPEMGSRRLESIVIRKHPDVVFHAHAHLGAKEAFLAKEQRSLNDFGKETRKIPVYNVSLPLNRSITCVRASKAEEGLHIQKEVC